MKKPVQNFLKASGLDLCNGEILKNLNIFSSTFQTTKLLFLIVWSRVGQCLVEIPFRARTCICYITRTLRTIMSLQH